MPKLKSKIEFVTKQKAKGLLERSRFEAGSVGRERLREGLNALTRGAQIDDGFRPITDRLKPDRSKLH